jgi:membrane-associated protease RseP (regulator of RpoE activity)
MVNEIEKGFDDEPVANLLRNLKRVEAPKDFEFKVKARVAAGTMNEKRPAGIPVWAKAAVPVGLVLAVGGYIGSNAIYTPAPADTPAVAAVDRQTQVEQPMAPVAVEPTGTSSQVITPSAPVRRSPAVAAVRRPARLTRPSGGSIDSAVRQGKSLDIRDRSAVDAFAEIGVTGDVDDTGMKIDSAASKSGLRAGDVVESISGHAVDAKTTVKGRLAGKTLRVRRDGKTVDVIVRN